jgi:hypothetical protein
MRLRITDRHGKTLREVRAWAITRVKQVHLFGRASDELQISLWSGGAYADFTEVFLRRTHGLQNLLVFDGGSLGVRKIEDLNGDGIAEIITDNPVLLDYSAYYFHRPHAVVTIFGWNGRRYTDVTRRYPRLALKEAQKDREEVEADLDASDEERREFEWVPFFHDKIIGYYANMLAAGRGSQARTWLKAHLAPSDWAWVTRHDRELRQLIARAGRHGADTSQMRIIEQSTKPPAYEHH